MLRIYKRDFHDKLITKLYLQIMKISDTISVDPSKTTLGARNNEAIDTLLRTSVRSFDNAEISRNSALTTLLFPSARKGLSAFDKFSVPMRSVFASLLIISGITTLQTAIPAAPYFLWSAIIAIAAGAFLALGMFTRTTMGISAIFFAIMGMIALRAGISDPYSFMLMFGCMVFFLTGAGKYSVDECMRKILKRNRISKNKKSGIELSYKAYQEVEKNL